MWFVDPNLLRRGQRLGRLADEAFGMSAVGGGENGAPPFNRFRSQTIMNHSRREKTQSGMTVLVVIPGEELLGKRTGILKRPKSFRETGPVFQSPEVTFRIRVVVGNVRAAVGFGDTQIRHQEGNRFGGH